MDFEEDKYLISLFRSQLKEDREAWEEVYGLSDCDDYDVYIGLQENEKSMDVPRMRKMCYRGTVLSL